MANTVIRSAGKEQYDAGDERGPTVSGFLRSLPTAIRHGMSTTFAAAAKNVLANRAGCSFRACRRARACIAATDMPWPYIGLKLQMASPQTR